MVKHCYIPILAAHIQTPTHFISLKASDSASLLIPFRVDCHQIFIRQYLMGMLYDHISSVKAHCKVLFRAKLIHESLGDYHVVVFEDFSLLATLGGDHKV